MDKKKISKLLIQKETISNLSKNAQGLIWGGYGEPDPMSEKPPWDTICILQSMVFYSKCDDINCDTIYKPDCFGPSTKDDGGTCDSSTSDLTCQGYC